VGGGPIRLAPELAAELVRRPVAVIATGGGILPARAAKEATATILRRGGGSGCGRSSARRRARQGTRLRAQLHPRGL